jgi:Flp pilus assembly protein TadG
MSRLARSRDEEGAYAILYALLVIVLVGVTALVIDISALREDRRQDRSAADAAAVAGANWLDTSSGNANPYQACMDAWSYLVTDLPATAPVDNKCTRFPTSVGTCPSVPVPYAAVSANPQFSVVITWPVPDNSTLLTTPDVRPASASDVQQSLDTDVDGVDPCSRIGVDVSLSRTPFLAGGAFGVGATTTEVTSVARGVSNPGPADVIAALNVLEPNTCEAIQTGGKASIHVLAVGTHPGVIAVESAGHETGLTCPNSNPYVIDQAKVGNTTSSIFADGPNGPGQGQILAYAMNPSPVGNVPQAYSPVGPSLLSPTPTPLAERLGPRPITDIFDCKNSRGCKKTATHYLTNLQAVFGGSGTPQPYAASPVPYGTLGFTTLPGTAVPGFQCNDGPQDKTFIPAGNWYINCSTLNVSGQLVIAGGNVVTAGGITIQGGCFAMNVPLANASSCPTVVGAGTSDASTNPAPATESILYLRAGSFIKNSQAALYMPRTFTYLANGAISFGAGSGTLLWTNPDHSPTEPTTCLDATCEETRFGKLALWSESSSTDLLGGQTSLGLRGIMFTPNATFNYQGQPTQNQTAAQVWANKLVVSGQSALVLAPDPADSVPRPISSAVLIR